MNFLLPGAFALSSLLAIIVVLYLLKLRRTEKEVSSTYLWRQMVRDREAVAPWQKLRFNWLMVLQLLFLALLVLALARPFNWQQGYSGHSVILILDSSGSMSATDVQPDRLDAAIKRAGQIIDDLPAETRLTMIEAGRETRILLSSSLDRRQALNALDEIQPGTGGSDFGLALELASAVASRDPDTRIVALSDGRNPLPEHLAVRGRLDYLPVGISGENQAITLLNVEPAAGGGWSAFIQVSNYGYRDALRKLNIYADDRLVNAYDLPLPTGGTRSIQLPDLPQDTTHVEAHLEGSDILPLDDRAYTVVRNSNPRRVALVSGGNIFLKTALKLLPGIELIEVDPAATQDARAADLVIYDGIVPVKLPEKGSLWFIAPPARTELFTPTGKADEPILRIVDPQDPLGKDLSLSGIHLMDTIRIPLPEWATPVISGDLPGEKTPILFRGEPGGRRVAVLAFNLAHSDLPLNVAFPVLCANLVDWLVPGTKSAIPAWVKPGEPVTLPQGIDQASITRPDGSMGTPLTLEGQLVYNDTFQPGFYQVNLADGNRIDFAVTPFSEQESDLKPAGTLEGIQSLGQAGSDQPGQSMNEWWRWLVLPALFLLMVEWIIYHRGGALRLRDTLMNRLKRIRQSPSNR